MDGPKLRKVERYADTHDGDAVVILRDPLDLAEPVAIPAEFADVLDMLDGRRTVAQIRQSLLMRGVHDIDRADLEAFVDSLSEQGFLEDDAFRERWKTILELFMEEDPRAPRAADVLYPSDPVALRALLEACVPDPASRTTAGSTVIGVVVPHAPPETAAPVLDETLRGLPPADELELVVILGTDHMLGLLPYVTTAKRYATPLATLPSDTATHRALERRLSWVTREEIRHRGALSLEMAALLLGWIYGDACPPVLPILCGQTVLRKGPGDTLAQAERFVATLDALLEDRKVLIWASAELSHGGPAYGRPDLTPKARDAIAGRDDALLHAVASARADKVAAQSKADFDHGRPSGGAVMKTLVDLLPVGTRTEIARYVLADAPGETPGAVGMAGVRFHRPS